MLHSTGIWTICGQCGGRPIRVNRYSGMVISTPISLLNSKTLTLERNAQKKTQQDRGQNRRQRGARTSTQSCQQQQRLCYQHHRLLRRPPPSLSTKPSFQIPKNRPFSLKPISSMEVELKFRLKDASAHQRLATLLSSNHVKTLIQSNFFFDTPALALQSDRAVLRLRFLDNDARCIISLKAKPTLLNGVSRVEEDEEEVDPKAGRECVNHPNKLLELESRIVKRVKEQFEGKVISEGLMCLGGFENVRQVFEWKGLKLEVDETRFPFGTCYEVECETENPEDAKTLLEEFLNANGIGYSYSEMTKFAVFRSGKLPL